MRHLFIAMVAFVIAGWTFVGHRAAAPADINERVRDIAAGIKAITPKTLGGGVILQSVHAEDATVVMRVDGISEGQLSESEVSRMTAASVCRNPGVPELLSAGAKLRFDLTTPGGAALPSVTVDHCA